MSSQITNIRSRLKEDARGLREVVDFECRGVPVTITAPRDVLLSDDEPSRRWIVKRYGYLLAHIPETVRP